MINGGFSRPPISNLFITGPIKYKRSQQRLLKCLTMEAAAQNLCIQPQRGCWQVRYFYYNRHTHIYPNKIPHNVIECSYSHVLSCCWWGLPVGYFLSHTVRTAETDILFCCWQNTVEHFCRRTRKLATQRGSSEKTQFFHWILEYCINIHLWFWYIFLFSRIISAYYHCVIFLSVQYNMARRKKLTLGYKLTTSQWHRCTSTQLS